MPRGIYKRTEYHRNISRNNISKIRNKGQKIGFRHSNESRIKMSLSKKGIIPKCCYWNKGKKYRKKNHKFEQDEIIFRLGRFFVVDYSLDRKYPYIQRARYVMEKYLGRKLLPTEIVHHINGIKTDDRIKNLKLFSSVNQHIKEHHNILGHKTPKPYIYKPRIIKVPKNFLRT